MFSITAKSQCRVQTNEREDGVTVRYLNPDRIGNSDKLILALSMQTNGEQFFIVTLSLFEKKAIKLKGKLTLKFANNKSSTFQHYSSEITTFNGYPATMSIFMTDNISLKNLSSSNIKIAILQLSNEIYQTIPVKMNSDILKIQYNCLNP
jgi:hypothetical protein